MANLIILSEVLELTCIQWYLLPSEIFIRFDENSILKNENY